MHQVVNGNRSRFGVRPAFSRLSWHAGILIATALSVSACRKPLAQGMARPPAPVTVAKAVSRDTPVYLDQIGKVTAFEVVTITPQVAGQIKERLFKDGDEVKAGKPLFTINPEPFDAALAQVQATWKKDQATASNAAANAERQRQLLSEKATSPQNYDDARFAADAAVAAAAADLALVKTAQINRDWCDIKSPIDGRAGQRLVDAGNVVKANEGSLLVVESLDKVYADFTVNERDLGPVRHYMSQHTLKTLIRLPTDPPGPGDGYAGELTFLDNAVQDSTGTIKVRATLDNKERHFWPGQFVNVRLVLYTAEQAVLVPTTAPQLGQQGSFVFVVAGDGTAQMQPVVLGQRQGDQIVVEQGLKAGDTVITDGQLTVIPGAPVRIVQPLTPLTQPAEPAPVKPLKVEAPGPIGEPTRSSERPPVTQPARATDGYGRHPERSEGSLLLRKKEVLRRAQDDDISGGGVA